MVNICNTYVFKLKKAVQTSLEEGVSNIIIVFLFSFPCQPLTDEIFYYYLFEVGFYLSLIISLFVDVKRKVCAICFSQFYDLHV